MMTEPLASKVTASALDRSAFPPTKIYDGNLLEHLSPRLCETDGMYFGNSAHYLGVGASALNIIYGLQQVAAAPKFGSILDFGSGAGRVTRWLRVAYPDASLTVADIRSADLDFCADAFGVSTWNPGNDIDRMAPPASFDLIWAGSVITHLPAFRTVELIAKLLSWLKPEGMLIASFHGKLAYSQRHELRYIESRFLPRIESEYAAIGYGYSDYEHKAGYGISFCTTEWILDLANRSPSTRLVAISEKVWDNHHDILALQKL